MQQGLKTFTSSLSNNFVVINSVPIKQTSSPYIADAIFKNPIMIIFFLPRRKNKPKSNALPVVRTPSKTLERPLGDNFHLFEDEDYGDQVKEEKDDDVDDDPSTKKDKPRLHVGLFVHSL